MKKLKKNGAAVKAPTNDKITDKYAKLPYPLNQGVTAFNSETKKDIFVLSSITALSSVFPSASGIYDGKQTYANLYSFIVGNAASGKSAAQYGNSLVDLIHDAKRNFKPAGMKVKVKGKTTPEKVLLTPGNITASALINLMGANEDGLLIAETEADTLAIAQGKEHGDFGDVLRKSYHNERVSKARATDNEYLEVKEPKLSISLTGTPDQVKNVIPNANDGLYSRFLFYKIEGDTEWQDVSPSAVKEPISHTIDPLKKDVLKYWELAKKNKFQFKLTKDQWEYINSCGKEWLHEAGAFHNTAESVAIRNPGMIFRIAMVLSCLRHFSSGKTSTKIACSETDFEIACDITQKGFKDGLAIFSTLSKSTPKKIKMSPGKMQYFNALPKKFEYDIDPQKIGDGLGIHRRTRNNYLLSFRRNKDIIPHKTEKGIWEKAS